MYNSFVDASVKCTNHLWMRLLNVPYSAFVDASVKCSPCLGVDTGALWGRGFHLSQAILTAFTSFLYIEDFCSLSKCCSNESGLVNKYS